jgi:hypothetical protein
VTLKIPRSLSRLDLSPLRLYMLVIAVSLNGLGISISDFDLLTTASKLSKKSLPMILGLNSSFENPRA